MEKPNELLADVEEYIKKAWKATGIRDRGKGLAQEGDSYAKTLDRQDASL